MIFFTSNKVSSVRFRMANVDDEHIERTKASLRHAKSVNTRMRPKYFGNIPNLYERSDEAPSACKTEEGIEICFIIIGKEKMHLQMLGLGLLMEWKVILHTINFEQIADNASVPLCYTNDTYNSTAGTNVL